MTQTIHQSRVLRGEHSKRVERESLERRESFSECIGIGVFVVLYVLCAFVLWASMKGTI